MPMKITIGALQDLKFDASLEYISPKAIENNGANQFEVKAAVHAVEGGKVRSGYSANAEIVLAKASKVIAVPESAIEFSGDSTFVYLVPRHSRHIRGASTGAVTEFAPGWRQQSAEPLP